ncbi:ribonuclease T2 family protein [Mannheimia pernigra]|uniref:ribonuclease T2 family protein n=1 Tax=Mannheimia pernigra TaxID=111844 RepID=UPI0013175130|nr:ribonuclease [Mannheimia pernigra]QHB17289.1 ribonuclease [Mannheimia pernigra]
MNNKKILFFTILAILGAATLLFTQPDKKSKTIHRPETQHTISQTSSLGNYDIQMKNDRLKQNLVETDYYLLALSWSPGFCQRQKRNNNGKVLPHFKYQCDGTKSFGWVIHGLWPQSAKAHAIDEHPRYCQGDLPMVAENTIKHYLPESPAATLLQGEWEKHGACAFHDARAYFEKQKTLFNALNLPNFATPKSDLFKWVKAQNPQLRDIYLGGGKDELYICYNKQWQPMDCPNG